MTNVYVANVSALSCAELSDTELDLIAGGAEWDGATRGAGWYPWRSPPPTPEQWRAWGQQLAAQYQANHPTHLGSPLPQ
jgi:hypothetical protein